MDPTGSRWRRIDSLLDQALDLPEAGRAAFLDRACPDDPELRAEVERILAADSGPRGPLDRTRTPMELLGEELAVDLAGRSIGPYRLLRKLGEGGMGVVYEAEQDNPRRAVALKLIRGGSLVSDADVRAFRREILSLARLRHPGIAAIHDAGQTPEGLHWFAMELVAGERLDRHVLALPPATQRKGLEARLDLFADVCAAVAHAHQRGVIHRDLKPSNVIVTGEQETPSGGRRPPRVKVLDFGLARVTASDVTGSLAATRSGLVQGTLPYISPEQARGEPEAMDVRTDVYALGVLLYEMLTGRLPLDLTGRPLEDALRALATEEPPRPSSLVRGLPGELETIVLKAMEKDPARRYDGVASLAEDVERWRNGLPIAARPPSTMYQLRKLVGRHRAGVAFAGAIVLFAVGWAITASVLLQRQREARLAAEEARAAAETEARKAERIQGFLRDMLTSVDPAQAQGRDVTVREVLDRAAADAEQALAEEPEVRAEIRLTLGMAYQSLGLYDEAEPHLEASLAERQALFGERHLLTAASVRQLAWLKQQAGDLAAAESLFVVVLEAYRALLPPDDTGILAARSNLASVQMRRGRLDEAIAEYRDLVAALRGAAEPDPTELEPAMMNLANALSRKGNAAEAEPIVKEVLAWRRERLGPDHPDLANCLAMLGVIVSKLGRHEEAEGLLREHLEITRRVFPEGHPRIATALDILGGCLRVQDRMGEAEGAYREALAVREAALGAKSDRTVESRTNLGAVLRALGRLDEAEATLRRALADGLEVWGADHAAVSNTRYELGRLLADRGRLADAEASLTEALRVSAAQRGPDDEKTVTIRNALEGVRRRR